MEGWFLTGDDVVEMLERAGLAQTRGAGALIVREGPAGDPLVLAGALTSTVSRGLLGVCVGLDGEERRHPTVLARDMTALDLLCNGRSLLCLAPPFGPAHLEAIDLCRQMWEVGTATSDGPIYPVPGALNRPQPSAEHGPLIALDLTGAPVDVPAGLTGAVDYLLRPAPAADTCLLERP